LLRADVTTYIPNRTDGYSISEVTARAALELEPRVVITVDNGTSAVQGIALLAQHGVDVIVTDHHLPPEQMAPAFAIVNPRRRDCAYPFKWLSGAGVAFKLAWGVAKCVCGGTRVTQELRDFLLDAMGFATLGTIADMVPLVGENRILVKHGLEALRQSNRPGFKALRDLAGLRGPLKASDVSFRLGPRLNAAGRLGHADAALRLLTCSVEAEARELAQTLEEENGKRQVIERTIFEEAAAAAEPFLGDRVLVLSSDRWHLGVIGIVAARLVELHQRPVFLIAESGARGRGSGRGVRGYDLHQLLTRPGTRSSATAATRWRPASRSCASTSPTFARRSIPPPASWAPVRPSGSSRSTRSCRCRPSRRGCCAISTVSARSARATWIRCSRPRT
jgi:single-stranded-DNA-specific exonuclease